MTFHSKPDDYRAGRAGGPAPKRSGGVLPCYFFATLVAASIVSTLASAQTPKLGSPVGCVIGQDCFIQQYPDMDPGPSAVDPWCGGATYDGHDGIDIRVRSFSEIGSVAVLAMEDGRVLRMRDGVMDKLMLSEADREAVEDIECGNGVVIATDSGLELQYCHLALGSVSVVAGDEVQKGDEIGLIGSSGMAAFPHVHVTVSRDGTEIDAETGRPLDQGCAVGPHTSMWDDKIADTFNASTAQIMATGFSGAVVDHGSLVVDGPPPAPGPDADALVGWAWFLNLVKGDVITLKILAADGSVFAESVLDPLESNKATYSAYVGKRGEPEAGQYTLEVSVDGRGLSAQTSIVMP